MFIRQLAYLTALARERHFARAAVRCSVSQPTLSAGIRSLENELGVAVVMRGHRFVGLTPEGLRVLEWAQRSLADLESLKQELLALKHGLVGRLRIGAVPTALPVLAPLTARLLAQHPQLSLDVSSATSGQIQQGLEGFELDLGITYLDNEPLRAFRSLPLYSETYIFLAPADEWPDRNSVTWSEAASANLCLLNPHMQNRRIVDAALSAAGSGVNARIEADSFVTLAAFLQTGAWASIFPASYLPFVPAGLAVKSMQIRDQERAQTIGIVYPDREPVPPSTRAVLAEAKATLTP
ncbi:transcriptional regulator, LysR family [Arboricoccus pini]|uniref:Transcriptional regulator, LysR family n=1 Tax=Arboricoccus pini TaxID=1963835 RepID=A0A212PYU8_9PROT|nr:LysR family transcriptional regulator [Arboricoccus pini]SNB52134.1 transcriptional regulator, LysR family [Arboricoccus pini]